MEAVNDKLSAFLSVSYGSGCGCGSSCGDSYGDGFGYGGGDDYGSGFGCSNSCGEGFGCGSGYGGGDDHGSGDNEGYGSSYGDGDGIKTIDGINLYYIDGVATIITAVYGNIAKGYILRDDLSLVGCYVAKSDHIYAHGNTIAEAVSALSDKLFDNMDVDDRISAFVDNFEHDIKYPVKDFYDWHHKLTGSCDQGRRVFASNHNIDLDNDMYTVDEFIALTENSYGGEVIKKLKEQWLI